MALFKSKAFWITVGTSVVIMALYPKLIKPVLVKLPVVGNWFA